MKFQEIAPRVTGLSTPIFGVQWNPPKSQRAIAARMIAFLEDRRVLLVPSEMEVPQHASWIFNGAVGELRSVFGIHIGAERG